MVNSYPRQGIVPPFSALQSCNGISEYYQNIWIISKEIRRYWKGFGGFAGNWMGCLAVAELARFNVAQMPFISALLIGHYLKKFLLLGYLGDIQGRFSFTVPPSWVGSLGY